MVSQTKRLNNAATLTHLNQSGQCRRCGGNGYIVIWRKDYCFGRPCTSCNAQGGAA